MVVDASFVFTDLVLLARAAVTQDPRKYYFSSCLSYVTIIV